MKRYVPLAEGERVAAKVVAAIRPHCQLVAACGSIRRGKLLVGDVDIVAVPAGDGMAEALGGLVGRPVDLKGQFEVDGLQVDIWLVREEGWGAALMFATGSKETNIAQRAVAKRRGYKLSQYGLFDRVTGAFVAGRTEQEVYEVLGLPWLEPEQR